MQRQGFIFGGASGAGHTYDFTGSNYKIVIGCNAGTDAQMGALGATAGKATLQGVEVCWHQFGSPRASATLLARSGSAFVLGGAGKPVTFRTTETTLSNANEADSGLAGAATVIVTDAGQRNFQKRGSGTLVLANVVRSPASAGGMVGSWQLGRGTAGNTGANTYFDGAVRETGTGTTNSFNGVTTPSFRGGVLEITSDWASRSMNDWSNGGGGFSAFGGDFSIGLGASKTWASSFVLSGEPLIFGSETANGRITFTSAINLGASGTNTREIRVLENPNASGDYARLSGILSAGGGTQGLLKSGAGLLQLTAANSYNGGTTVRDGTLCANNVTGSGTGSGAVTVESGAAVGGSGVITGAVTVAANGTLDAGELAGAVGTLTVNASLTLAESARVTCDYNASTGDKVVVNGTLTLPVVATVTTVGTAAPKLPITVFTATTLISQPSGVAGWTLTGPLAGEELRIVGNTVVIHAKPRGTVLLLR